MVGAGWSLGLLQNEFSEEIPMRQLSRRAALALGAGSAALTVMGWGRGAYATPQAAAADIAKFTGGKPVEQGKVSIEMPEIAENGNTVPLSVAVESPMTQADHVTDVMVLAEGNPNPGVATFHFTPLSGKAEASTRIRLATTQNIVVVAKTSAGKFYSANKLVKVTIGGCGG
jgi:sulfur-oxidizing protein SoxY